MNASVVLRYLCLLTAVANMGGNILLFFLQRPLFERFGIPHPVDMRGFAMESLLSFLMGVVALMIFLNPPRATGLLQLGIGGKGAYALLTYYFFAFHGLHPFYLLFAAWDAAYVVIFFLYWIHLESPDLLRAGTEVMPGLDRRRTNRAAIIGFSLTGNGRNAIEHLKAGLQSKGYEVDDVRITPAEPVFRFPMSAGDFASIVIRAFFRYPAFIEPLRVPRSDYDLVVVESPTWLLGMAAPVEAVFQDPANRWLFAGRDAAAIVVCRGAHRRTRAMMARWLERLGANVLTARGFVHQGREPRRLMSLWFYLIFRKAGFPPVLAEPRYGLADETLSEIRRLGEQLALRPATRRLAAAMEAGNA
jgi:hypothetical protein